MIERERAMNIYDYLEPDRLLKAAIILEELQCENSSNLNGTFPHGREVIVALMALSMKKYQYYFITCSDDFKKEYQDKKECLARLNEYSYVEKAFNLSNSCAEDELLLKHVKNVSGAYKIGVNASALAYALSGYVSMSNVKSWLHGLAAGHTSDYIAAYNNDSCVLAKELIKVAIHGAYKYSARNRGRDASSVDSINDCFKFVVDDLASNYGFKPEDVLLME
jgi:hypothetical protein